MGMRWMATVVAAVALGLTSSALAETVNDFKEAADRSGCQMIPYWSPRSDCESKGRGVEEYCKQKTWSCDSLDPAGIKRNIDGVKSKLESLRRERDDLNSKKSSSSDDAEKHDLEGKIADKEKEIRALEDKVAEWEKKLEDERKEINARLDVGKQCRDNRIDVQKIFANAKSKLESESDPEVKPYAEKIIGKIKDQESGHQTAIDTVKSGIEKCERML